MKRIGLCCVFRKCFNKLWSNYDRDCGYLKGFDALQQNEVFIPGMRLKITQGLFKEITIKELNVLQTAQKPSCDSDDPCKMAIPSTVGNIIGSSISTF